MDSNVNIGSTALGIEFLSLILFAVLRMLKSEKIRDEKEYAKGWKLSIIAVSVGIGIEAVLAAVLAALAHYSTNAAVMGMGLAAVLGLVLEIVPSILVLLAWCHFYRAVKEVSRKPEQSTTTVV